MQGLHDLEEFLRRLCPFLTWRQDTLPWGLFYPEMPLEGGWASPCRLLSRVPGTWWHRGRSQPCPRTSGQNTELVLGTQS